MSRSSSGYKTSNKNNSPQLVNRYKSSENILDKVNKTTSTSVQHNFSEGELLEDKSVFDFTSNRTKLSSGPVATLKTTTGPFDHLLNKPNTAETVTEELKSKSNNNDSNSDKSHEPFGSTEFPTLKRQGIFNNFHFHVNFSSILYSLVQNMAIRAGGSFMNGFHI